MYCLSLKKKKQMLFVYYVEASTNAFTFALGFLLLSAFKQFFFVSVSDALCGKYSGKRGRIVGGTKVMPGEFPWIVSIRHKGSHTCGGVVVNKKWIITAAHCFCR